MLLVAAFGLAYPYVIYPLLLAVVSRIRAAPLRVSAATPSASILVSAFNEEARIAHKIDNFLALDYPPERVSMFIGTDGSADSTASVIRGMQAPRVTLVERAERSGKTVVLNDLASRSTSDLFVFTDVNASFRADAIRQLATILNDPAVGLVSGVTVIRSGNGNVEVEGAYYRFESWLKQKESECGWLAGADGAIYAMRAALYRHLPDNLINDLVHPCQVVAQGYQARLAPLAVSEEPAGEGAEREFHRQTRITAQAAYLLATQTGPLLQSGRWGMLWVLLSHKWLRWIIALWILVGAGALAVLAPKLAVLAAVAFAGLLLAWQSGAGWASLPVFFLLIHFAYLRGLWHAIKGERYITWKPRSG